MAQYTDKEIDKLINEKKILPNDFVRRINNFKKGNNSKTMTSSIEIKGKQNNTFKIIIRYNTIDKENFSIILGIIKENEHKLFRLLRYDGSDREHTNTLEGNTISYECHIHKATERYQEELNIDEEYYAESTTHYNDLNSALTCFIKNGGFIISKNQQLPLMGWINYENT